MRKIKTGINLKASLILVAILVSLFSIFSFVSACDEAEMQTMMTGSVTGNVIGSSLSSNLGILLWVKESLIIIALVLLIIYLIKLIGKK